MTVINGFSVGHPIRDARCAMNDDPPLFRGQFCHATVPKPLVRLHHACISPARRKAWITDIDRSYSRTGL